MKALSINQPWAWCIVNGYKGVENRDWNTKYRGEFLIHAGKKFDKEGWLWIVQNFPEIPIPHDIEEFDRGGIVGKARLINTVHVREERFICENDKPWFFGEYGFILDSAEPCEFKQCKGALGFFTPDYNSRYKEPTPKKKPLQRTLL